MTRNPYAPPPMSTISDFEPSVPPRTSALAVSSLVFGLLCCIPGVGLLSTILGGAALVRISSARGQLHGRSLAIVGMILGLIGTGGYLLFLVGANYVAKDVVARTQAISKAIETMDVTSLRPVLSAATAAEVNDEQLKAFAAKVRDTAGPVKAVPKSLLEWANSLSGANALFEKAAPQLGKRGENMIPVPVTFENGKGLVVLQIADQPGSGFLPPVKNIGVLAPDGITWIWLRDPASRGLPAVTPPPVQVTPKDQATPQPDPTKVPTPAPTPAPAP